MKKIWGQIYTCWCYWPLICKKKYKGYERNNNEQLGWLEITYLSDRDRICRGDK